ncbi:MAG: GNAT family N-acetyltransferase [Hyphomicrobiales bacterium]|nr:GNAT family N-acetyltransferase [Hyphomicrobiales bacterium]
MSETPQIPTLQTQRLILRAFRAQDFPAFEEMCADEELMRYVGGRMDRVDAWRRMAAYAGQWALRGYGSFALEETASGTFVGYCGIYDPAGWPEREIHWGLRRRHLGQGFITEAARQVRDYAYDTLGFETITSCIVMENTPSIAVAKRLGAVLDRTVEFRGRPMGVFRHLSPQTLRTGGRA